MEKIREFTDLQVWEKAHNLVLEIYTTIKNFPQIEKYRHTDQLLRAVVSIPANIAEGFGRYSKKEFIQFLIISRGSLSEVKYFLILSKDLKYISNDSFNELNNHIDETGRMLNGLINSLKRKL